MKRFTFRVTRSVEAYVEAEAREYDDALEIATRSAAQLHKSDFDFDGDFEIECYDEEDVR